MQIIILTFLFLVATSHCAPPKSEHDSSQITITISTPAPTLDYSHHHHLNKRQADSVPVDGNHDDVVDDEDDEEDDEYFMADSTNDEFTLEPTETEPFDEDEPLETVLPDTGNVINDDTDTIFDGNVVNDDTDTIIDGNVDEDDTEEVNAADTEEVNSEDEEIRDTENVGDETQVQNVKTYDEEEEEEDDDINEYHEEDETTHQSSISQSNTQHEQQTNNSSSVLETFSTSILVMATVAFVGLLLFKNKRRVTRWMSSDVSGQSTVPLTRDYTKLEDIEMSNEGVTNRI